MPSQRVRKFVTSLGDDAGKTASHYGNTAGHVKKHRLARLYLRELSTAYRLPFYLRLAWTNTALAVIILLVAYVWPPASALAALSFFITLTIVVKQSVWRAAFQMHRWCIRLDPYHFSTRDALSIIAGFGGVFVAGLLLLLNSINTAQCFALWGLAGAALSVGGFLFVVPREDMWINLSQKHRRLLSEEEIQVLSRAGEVLGFTVDPESAVIPNSSAT